jgi:hypothetical protein
MQRERTNQNSIFINFYCPRALESRTSDREMSRSGGDYVANAISRSPDWDTVWQVTPAYSTAGCKYKKMLELHRPQVCLWMSLLEGWFSQNEGIQNLPACETDTGAGRSAVCHPHPLGTGTSAQITLGQTALPQNCCNSTGQRKF